MSEEPINQDNPAGTQQGWLPKTDNAIIMDLVAVHPLTTFNELEFVDLLEHSLSLSTFEKKRVIDAIPNLSQFQIDELVKVFEDERTEFRKLMPTEGETIKWLLVKAKNEWEQLKTVYIEEWKQKDQQGQDQQKIDEMRKNLGL